MDQISPKMPVRAENISKGAECEQPGQGQKNRRQLKQRLEKLVEKVHDLKLSDEDLKGLFMTKYNMDLTAKTQKPKSNRKLFVALSVIAILPIIVSIIPVWFGIYLIPSGILAKFKNTPCIVDNGGIVMEVARPLVDCNICRDLWTVPVEKDLTKELFIEKYAYSNRPVLVKGATKNWTAMSKFSYQFFKTLYQSRPDALASVDEECQFFPYKTEFDSLRDVFEMNDDRAHLKPGQPNWYIGWSNCHPDTAAELRKHYRKPYFLPADSESSSLDWIFMGGSGEGANIHLDYVQRPSWQAQISGRKSWVLVPSPECEAVCRSMNVTVEKGDIIVVDTNSWYHSTFVHPGEISITIGSEYD